MNARTGKLALLATFGLLALLAATSFVDPDAAAAAPPRRPSVVPVRIEPLAHGDRYRIRQLLAFHGPADARLMIPLNDTAMGGESTGEFVFEENHGVFRGVLVRSRGNSFASVRSIPRLADLAGYSGIVVRAKGDGRAYQLDLRETDLVRGVAWSVEISPPADEWAEIAIPFSAFEPRRRNRPAPEAGPVDPERITSIGFRTRGDNPGPFELRVSEVSAWAPRTWDL